MTEIDPADSTDRFEVRLTADSHFGWIRTRLSLERTMMASVRTATALIGFGFAIVQYLDRLQQLPDARPVYLPSAPRGLGLGHIACVSSLRNAGAGCPTNPGLREIPATAETCSIQSGRSSSTSPGSFWRRQPLKGSPTRPTRIERKGSILAPRPVT